MFPVDKNGIPVDPNAYRSRDFWDTRYATGQHHDWLAVSKEDLAEHFKPFITEESRVLVLGCGTSPFSRDLLKILKPHSVESVDYAPSAITHMQETHPDMTWRVMDIRDMQEYANGSFDCVVDKATLDAFFADGSSPWDPSDQVRSDVGMAIKECHRVLKPSGWFLSVSLGQPHFRLPYYTVEGLVWQQVDKKAFSTFSHIYCLRR